MKFPRMSQLCLGARRAPPRGGVALPCDAGSSVGAATLMLSTAVAAVALPNASAAPTLLSQGKPATASSTENAGTPAAAAVDGNTGTRWSSAFSDPQWIQVDLGATATHQPGRPELGGGVRRRRSRSRPPTDARHLDDHLLTTTGTGGTQTLTVTGTGRYVRMYGTARGHRLRLLAVGVPGLRRALGHRRGLRHHQRARMGRPATASSTENAGTPAAAAVDGNTGTRWSSAATDPQWLQVDLGSRQPVCQVVLQLGGRVREAFQIQTSTDGSHLDHDLLDHHRHRRHPDARRRPAPAATCG